MENKTILPDEIVLAKIHYIRKQKIMLDRDLAKLYGVPTKVLNQAVKRHLKRFPKDFMFQLTENELESLRSQFVTSKKGGLRYLPFAFTEQGVAMLSSVLNSEIAIDVNIQIIRIFTKMRTLMTTNTEILLKLEQVQHQLSKNQDKTSQHDEEIALIFKYLKKLLNPANSERTKIGFKNV
jgi:hypothetical protein